MVHPASQNFRVLINDECDKPGPICASVICASSHGISRLHVCVDCIRLPLGNKMLIGFFSGTTFTAGAPATKI